MPNVKYLIFSSQNRGGLYEFYANIPETGAQTMLEIKPPINNNLPYSLLLTKQFLDKNRKDKNYTINISGDGNLVLKGNTEGMRDLVSLLKKFDDCTSSAGGESWNKTNVVLRRIRKEEFKIN